MERRNPLEDLRMKDSGGAAEKHWGGREELTNPETPAESRTIPPQSLTDGNPIANQCLRENKGKKGR